jgi:two-component system CheB/CheR fusion protein
MTTDQLPIVAIGASAGGLAALRDFFSEISADSGAAFVVIQHLDPNSTSNLAAILQSATPMAVSEVSLTTTILPNHVYVISPKIDLEIAGTDLIAIDRNLDASSHTPINRFIYSLASERGILGAAVILSGAGSDGAAGCRILSGTGGMVLAQSPETAAYADMPHAVIATGCADVTGSPAMLASELNRYLLSSGFTAGSRHFNEETLKEIFRLIKKFCNFDLSEYKQTTVIRRIRRRMTQHRIDTLETYLDFLKEHRQEATDLMNFMLIGVTEFFRDQDAFIALVEKAFAEIIRHETTDRPVRVWVPACSTGEEAYTIAIMLCDYLTEKRIDREFVVFATDVNANAIRTARKGLYPDTIESSLNPSILQRYFIQSGNHYEICRKIRDRCIFAVHDITRDPPFSQMDMVSCRNLLIYFSPKLQLKILQVFLFSLVPRGILFLGGSESLGECRDWFDTIDERYRIYMKRSDMTQSRKFMSNYDPIIDTKHGTMGWNNQDTLKNGGNIDRKVLDQIIPAGWVIDGNFSIVRILGDTSRYLSPGSGLPSVDLRNCILKELRTPLLAAIRSSESTGTEALTDTVTISRGKDKHPARLRVVPFELDSANYFTVIVEESPDQIPTGENLPFDASAEATIKNLSNEIDTLQHELSEAVEQREMIREELRSSNEEIISHNEELRSTNEELQTTKEELQSNNEELVTLNDELQSRNRELSGLNDDIVNFINSSHVPMIFLDLDLNIRRFTPSVKKFFRLIDDDIGRSIRDIQMTEIISDFCSKVLHTIETLIPQETEFGLNDSWYIMQIRPYLSFEKALKGAIVTFIDISSRHQADLSEKSARAFAESIVATVREPLLVLDSDGKIAEHSRSFSLKFDDNHSPLIGRAFDEICEGRLATPEMKRTITNSLRENTNLTDFEVHLRDKTNTVRRFLVNIRPIPKTVENKMLLMIGFEDITQRKELEDHQQRAVVAAEEASSAKSNFLANISHEIRTPLSAITGFSELLSDSLAAKGEAGEYAAAIHRNVTYLRQLLDDVLDMSKIEAGKLSIDKSPINVRRLVSDVIAMTRPKADAKGIKVDFSVAQSAPELIVSDPIRLKQILINLLDNSVKFTEAGRVEITIDASDFAGALSGKQLSFSVKDTGIGISEQEKARLFEPFSQADPSITRRYGGTGLGLVLSRKLALLLGGDLFLKQSSAGQGSEFVLLLDYGFSSPELKIPSVSPAGSEGSLNNIREMLKGTHILLAEDNDELRMLTSHFLHDIGGAEVDTAVNGKETVEKALANKYDLILMDIQMPGTSGIDATKKIRASGLTLPIVALTARADTNEAQSIMEAGCNGYIFKPYDPSRLFQEIRSHIKTGSPGC